MDRDHVGKRDTNPIVKANILSLSSFFYTLKLFIKGYTNGLETDDVYEILPNCCSKKLGDNLEKQWQIEKNGNRNFSICHALWKSYGKIFLGLGLVQFTKTIITTVWSPKALSKLISYFSPNQTDLSKEDAIFYGCMVVGLELLNLLLTENIELALGYLSTQVKAAVSSILYRKSLKMNSESLSEATTGKIVTIITKDLRAFTYFIRYGNNAWIAIIQTCVICYLMYSKIGIASIPGTVFFFVVLPIQMFIGSKVYKARLECSKKTDERLELIREILSAIRIIKMCTWEKFFEKKINEARKKELIQLHKYFFSYLWIYIVGSTCSKIAFFLFLTTYVWMGHNITAEIVFYIFAITAEVYAAAKRTESVLRTREVAPRRDNLDSELRPKVVFNQVDIRIHGKSVLENISITIDDPFTIVVGHVGTGKTTFLKAILQEFQITGDLKVSGKISYASQEPWLFPSTIRNNILFGEEFWAPRYQEVLKVCCLNYDLSLLPEGDGTIVGDRGVNLSKGQQARVNLARAVYRDSDIYLLDDCLAALDAHVSNQIFTGCIKNFLRDKIRIFVTNNSDHIRDADRIIVINNRTLKFGEKLDSKIQKSNDMKDETRNADSRDDVTENKQIYHEDKRSGRVPFKCYRKYIAHGGGVVVFSLIVALFAIDQSTSSISDKLVSKWITLEQNLTNYKEANETDTLKYQDLLEERTLKLNLYITAAILLVPLALVKNFAFYYFARVASRSIHEAMVRNILNSTMKFFDGHLIGNILTRFTADCLILDEIIVFIIMHCIQTIFTVAGGIILLTTVDYVFLIEIVVVLIFACALKQFCQPTGRNIERLHVIARGPINGHLNATLEGLTTIRACDAQEIVKQEFDGHQNLSSSAYFMLLTIFHALKFFMNLISIFFIALVILQFLFLGLDTSVGDVGLVITQSFAITNIISSGIVSIADFENLMICVERLLEFTEIDEEDKSGKVMTGWPKTGAVKYQNVSSSYNTKEILSNINFVINSKEKIGIVGRTGAGKSSIVSTLFRLYEIKGKITIDGIDIKDVSLDWLRSKISVIPQDPYLFTGTVRENLDPLWQYQDEEIWRVLDELRLKNLITDLSMKIDKGSTFSAGQKQLLCLARVILRKNKIVVLDEATANVDEETDILINEAVQKYFSACTVVVITHRLPSVADCHKVLVLNNGRVSEFGEPSKLMIDTSSFLHSVIQ